MATSKPTGVGLGLRFEMLDELLARIDGDASLDPIAFFEIAPENYMRRGGFVPAALEQIAQRFPIVSHGLTMSLGGVDPFDDRTMHTLRAFLETHHIPLHSDHLCFSSIAGRFVHDLLPLPLTRQTAIHVARRIREAQDRLGMPIAVENITRYFMPGPVEMTESAFIGEVLDQSGAGLLLDVNNAYVNAINDGSDPLVFLAPLPLDRVVAIHVAGHEKNDSMQLVLDTHGANVVDPVLELLSWAIERTGPVPVVLERDHHIPSLDAMLHELGRVERAYRDGLSSWKARRDG